ncbi:MAG: hypothetical protein EXS48_02965 [Candidatus Staskawiczbacteria bacterium]|nr:hypothetical protein [Candidatus Staskawiczbacteria bacterium]
MPTNPENNYEDSYQKEGRLRRELELLLSEVREFLATAKRGISEVGDLPVKVDALEEELEESNKLEQDLKTKLDEMKAKYETITDVDQQIDASTDIFQQQSKIHELWIKQDDLQNELLKIYENEPGMKGDVEGTMAVIKLKMQKIEDIRKQLEELGS